MCTVSRVNVTQQHMLHPGRCTGPMHENRSYPLTCVCMCGVHVWCAWLQVLGRQMEAKQKRLLALQSAADMEVCVLLD
jgi:hypothetical protein